MVKRPYPPGEKAKKRRGPLSEYGKELKEKQKLRNWYNLSEKQISRYAREALNRRSKLEDAGEFFIKKLESRLDNVIFQAGFAVSRIQARQLIGHGYFLVNGRKINIPSYQVKRGDKISLHPKSARKTIFQNIASFLKKHKAPSWIKIDGEKLEAEITGQANLAEVNPPVEISSIFEFYSK